MYGRGLSFFPIRPVADGLLQHPPASPPWLCHGDRTAPSSRAGAHRPLRRHASIVRHAIDRLVNWAAGRRIPPAREPRPAKKNPAEAGSSQREETPMIGRHKVSKSSPGANLQIGNHWRIGRTCGFRATAAARATHLISLTRLRPLSHAALTLPQVPAASVGKSAHGGLRPIQDPGREVAVRPGF
jgi:hypothetical protein